MCSRLEIAQNGMLGETRAEDTKISISCILTVGGYYFTLIAVWRSIGVATKGHCRVRNAFGLKPDEERARSHVPPLGNPPANFDRSLGGYPKSAPRNDKKGGRSGRPRVAKSLYSNRSLPLS